MKRLLLLLTVIATYTFFGSVISVDKQEEELIILSENFDFIKESVEMAKTKKLNRFFFLSIIGYLQRHKDYYGLQFLNAKLEDLRNDKNCIKINKLQFRIQKSIRYIQEHSGLPIL